MSVLEKCPSYEISVLRGFTVSLIWVVLREKGTFQEGVATLTRKSNILREKIFAGITLRNLFLILWKLIFVNRALLKILRELIFANWA